MKVRDASHKSFSWQCAAFIESLAKRYILGTGKERSALWYDQTFDKKTHCREHYTKSKHYFIWTVIADRLLRSNWKSVLDIGCGSGQLATLLRDAGIEKYHGMDFSERRIAWAKRICPQHTFSIEDAFTSNRLETHSYDSAVCTEFLEHVDRDVNILARIKTGTRFIGTVPNFPNATHVRHFESVEQVKMRYRTYFEELNVTSISANDRGMTYFLLDGIIK